MPTFGSLFAGIGGLDLGLERAGWTCRWQVEIDPFCRRVLAQHWPRVAHHGDVRSFPLADTERVDLVCGGFPCQPVSVAGKQLAQADARWLWPEFARIVRVLRPRLVLVENVPGLLVGGAGDVLGDLAALGYDAEWECISAADMGAPHLRERVWLVAYPPNRDGVDIPGIRRALERQAWRPFAGDSRLEMADAQRDRLERLVFAGPAPGPAHRSSDVDDPGWWAVEPDVGRVAHGVPARVDRLRALGNAVVPQVAEWIGRRLMEMAR